MKINVEWDSRSLLLRLRNGEKRLAYATVNALNATALKIQEEEYAHVRTNFHVRRPAYFFGPTARWAGKLMKAKVKTGVLYATLLAGKEAAEGIRRLYLAQFEKGGLHLPGRGSKNVAVPIWARPDPMGPIDPQFTFKAMRLTAYRGKKIIKRPGRRGSPERGFGTQGNPTPDFGLEGVQWRGNNWTFMLKHTRTLQHGGVFQRTGAGRADIRLLWKFQPTVPIDERLMYFPTANRAWAKWYKEAFEQEVLKTLAFHKYRFVR